MTFERKIPGKPLVLYIMLSEWMLRLKLYILVESLTMNVL